MTYSWLYIRNTAKKEKKKKVKKAAPKKEDEDEENEGLASSSDEEFNSDDDLDNFEEISDDDEMALLEEANESEDDLDLDNDEEMEQLLAQQQQQRQSKKKAVKVDNESDEEMDYETKPRKIASEWTRKDYHTKLPIKLASGKIHQLDENQESEEEEEEEKVPTFTAAPVEQIEEEDDDEEENQPKLSKKEYLIKKKEELALIASNLQGDPEEYVSQLKTLRSIYRDDNVTVKKLALLTQLAVYKDIIPGYRIRPLTALEEETQVSRDVKKMREYEKSLLSNYELYLKDLNVLLSSKFLQLWIYRPLI